MRLYHRTYCAKQILESGFKDGVGNYLTSHQWQGVWFSDVPLDINEGAKGDTLLVIRIPEEVAAQYEWVEEGKGYREFLIPASIVNSYRQPSIVQQKKKRRKP